MKGNFIDISGQTFYELTAIEYINKKDRTWLWRCSCGKECVARKNDVTSGRKKSCGHLSNRGGAVINIGDKFNEWTVLEDLGNRHFWCRCSCGQEKRVHSYDLRKGKSKSCGHVTKGSGKNGKIDLKDQVFGEWTVLEYDKNNNKYGYWVCKCSCGNIKSVRGIILRKGESTSCGHATNSFKDLTGGQFGEWEAIEYLGNYMWKCKCSCGKIGEVASYDLTHNNSTNCGHKRTPELVNKRFGKLVVKRYIGDNNWECNCDCGNITFGLTNNLVAGNKKSCGCLIDDKKNDIIDNIKNTIQTFIASNGQLPFIADIAEATNLTPTTVHKYIDEFNLRYYINKCFGSKPERDIYEFINQFTEDIILHDRTVLQGQELDIYLPSKKLAIEFNGDYWHSMSKLNNKYYHQQKTINCAKQGIQLIHIFEYEWNDIAKQDKLLKYLERLLVKENTKVVYARETEVKQILSDEATEFCNRYHLQGSVNATVNLGCYYNNELIGVMTFGKPRFNSNYEYEIHRLCWRDNVSVVGGAAKLFKYFLEKYNPNTIITYSDISKFTGNIYTKLGFKPIQPNPITEPNYIWVSTLANLVLPRYKTMKSALVEQGLGTGEQTETEIMISNNFVQVYDCGNIKLEWKKEN